MELNSPSMFFLVGCNGLEGGGFESGGILERLGELLAKIIVFFFPTRCVCVFALYQHRVVAHIYLLIYLF